MPRSAKRALTAAVLAASCSAYDGLPGAGAAAAGASFGISMTAAARATAAELLCFAAQPFTGAAPSRRLSQTRELGRREAGRREASMHQPRMDAPGAAQASYAFFNGRKQLRYGIYIFVDHN